MLLVEPSFSLPESPAPDDGHLLIPCLPSRVYNTLPPFQSLLRQMMGIYSPIFFENKTWPDSIRNDFSAQLHKFLASLTDTRWKMEGKTVLYIPGEGLKMSPELASKNKELIQRLESRKPFCIMDDLTNENHCSNYFSALRYNFRL